MSVQDRSGQAVIEGIGTCACALCLTIGLTMLFRAEWNRVRCVHLAFETSRRVLAGARPASGRVDVRETERTVTATARCDGIRETVTLPRLEFGVW